MRDDDRPWDPTAGPLVPMPEAANWDKAVLNQWMKDELAEQERRLWEWRVTRGEAEDVEDGERGRTVVVGVRVLRQERRELVRVARRHSLSVSDLVRRWVRDGLEAERLEYSGSLAVVDPDAADTDAAGSGAAGSGDPGSDDPGDRDLERELERDHNADPDGDHDVDDTDDAASERTALRRAVAEAADAAVDRITDELRRLRELLVSTG